MPRPNWFFGFPLPAAIADTLPEPPPSIRRVHPEDVHLTLAFLGACGEPGAGRAVAALDRALGGEEPHAAIPITLGEVVPMGGSRRSYSALSALLDDGREAAARCIANLRDVLADAASVRRDARPPKPHVTLARPRRRATDAQRAAGLEWAASLDLGGLRASLDRVALYTWSDVRRERSFRIVTERPLR